MSGTQKEATIHVLGIQYTDYMLLYPRFFYDNRAILQKHGIVYPCLRQTKEGFCQIAFWAAMLSLPAVYSKEALEHISPEGRVFLEELALEIGQQSHILFVAPVGLLRCLPFVLGYLRDATLFPHLQGAACHCGWLASDRARELDGACRYNFPLDTRHSLGQPTACGQERWLSCLKTFLACDSSGKPAITLSENASPQPKEVVLAVAGLPIVPDECSDVSAYLIRSRELLYFVRRNSIPYALLEHEIDRSVLMENDAFPPMTVLPPYVLEGIFSAFTPKMQEILQAFQCNLRFSPLPSQDNWRPFRFSQKQAYYTQLSRTFFYQSPQFFRCCLGDVLSEKPASCPTADCFVAPLMSVLTLTKDHKAYLGDCIESVLAQETDFPVEHIIVDDCSTDGTSELLMHYAKQHASIVPIFLQGGAPPGRNVKALFQACRSKYAALCDGDDYFTDPLKLQRQVDYLEANPHCSMCFHSVQIVYEGGEKEPEIYPPASLLPRNGRREFYLADLFRGNPIQTSSAVYRWRFREGLPPWFRPDLCPGDWYWHLLHAEEGKIGFLPQVMSVYRRHKSAVYYLSGISRQAHRRQHGLNELCTYRTVNEHFKGRYFLPLAHLADGVLSDLLRLSRANNDRSLLDDACKLYPEFCEHFLKTLQHIQATQMSAGQ